MSIWIKNSLISEPLTVSQNMKSMIVNENGQVLFKCMSEGTPSASAYYWSFRDVNLSKVSYILQSFVLLLNFHYHFKENSSDVTVSGGNLTLKNIKQFQDGEYTCVVEQKLKTYRNLQQTSFVLVVAGKFRKFASKISTKSKSSKHIFLFYEC